MIKIEIPGQKPLEIHHLVLDYNGTIAFDGTLLPGVSEALIKLSEQLSIHVLTADTFGFCAKQLEDTPCQLYVLPKGSQDEAKLAYVKKLDPQKCVCIGNGRNDRLMLKEAALGIGVILGEGAAVSTVTSADVVCTDILSAFGLLQNPLRLIATLRI